MAEGQNNDRGLRRNRRIQDGNTQLHLAALKGNAAVIKALLEIDMEELEVKNALGYTPLYLAVLTGKNDAVKCFLEAGADYRTVANDGSTIWKAAALAGIRQVKKILYSTRDVSLKEVTPDLSKSQNDADSEGGEFETNFENRSFDGMDDSSPLNDENQIRQIKEVLNDIQEQKIQKNSSEKSENSAPSAISSTERRLEKLTISDESENKEMLCPKVESFSPSRSSASANSENETVCDVNEEDDEDEDLKLKITPTENIDDDNEISIEMYSSSGNNGQGVEEQVPEEDSIGAIGPENEEESSDEANSDVENKSSSKEMSKSKKSEEKMTVENTVSNENSQEARTENSQEARTENSQEARTENSQDASADTNEADTRTVENYETIILGGLGRKGKQRRPIPATADLRNDQNPYDPPKFIRQNQRRNRCMRQMNNRKKETKSKDDDGEDERQCKTIMIKAFAFLTNALSVLQSTVGLPLTNMIMKERVCACMREFFATRVPREVDVNSIDDEGRSLLHHTAAVGAVETVERLVRAGANVNLLDKENLTPMLFASLGGSHVVIEILARKGAKLNEPSPFTGETPLHIAAKLDYHQAVRKLLELGADVNALDKTGSTALQLAVKYGFHICADIIINFLATPQTKKNRSL